MKYKPAQARTIVVAPEDTIEAVKEKIRQDSKHQGKVNVHFPGAIGPVTGSEKAMNYIGGLNSIVNVELSDSEENERENAEDEAAGNNNKDGLRHNMSIGNNNTIDEAQMNNKILNVSKLERATTQDISHNRGYGKSTQNNSIEN
ncbi:hypothetical protein SCAR479_02661 [Seiridium cardinale]|uniref:Uncharacterized protein n=1 Tax=Seiridium cardinale TaxID=138064 RepID=A0ABR2Y386_9PEZI